MEFAIGKAGDDARFQTVSGLSVEYDYESFKEGGENRFEHKLPVRSKYADTVLKRGMLDVIKWCLAAFRDRDFRGIRSQRHLDERARRSAAHVERGARYPQKWLVSDFYANESSIVIETMELTYRYFTIQ